MVVEELGPLFLVVAGVGTLTLLCGFSTVGGVLLFDGDVTQDGESVFADVEAVAHLVGSGALILAADSVDAVKLVGDLLAVGLLNGAGASLVLGNRSRVATDSGVGKMAIAVQLVSVAAWLGAGLVASTAASGALCERELGID